MLDSLTFETFTSESAEKNTTAAVAKLDREPRWLHPHQTCPLEPMRSARIPPEPKTHPCAPDLDACVKQCRKGDAWLCMEAADELAIAGIHQQHQQALYMRSCELGFIEGCGSQAALLFTDPNSEAQWTCAAETFALGCEAEDWWQCAFYGRALAHGRGVEQDLQEGRRFLRRTCIGDPNGKACLMARSVEAGLPVDNED